MTEIAMDTPAPLPTLDALGLLHGTDKASVSHGYLKIYDDLLAPLRHGPRRILEIGVKGGASLRMWRDYFPEGQIFGADINPATLSQAGERISVHLADQSKPETLVKLVKENGPFDVIIDDGSHIWKHQNDTMRALLPLVKSGGFFIVEDLQTSYGPNAHKYSLGGGETAGSFCLRFAERVLAGNTLKLDPEPDPFFASAWRLVHNVTFAKHTAIFHRR